MMYPFGLLPRRLAVGTHLPARLEAGFLLRRLQRGETLGMPVASHDVDWTAVSRIAHQR